MNNDLIFAHLEFIGKELFDNHRLVASENPVIYGMAYGIIGTIGKNEFSFSFNEDQLKTWNNDFGRVKQKIEELIFETTKHLPIGEDIPKVLKT